MYNIIDEGTQDKNYQTKIKNHTTKLQCVKKNKFIEEGKY